MTVYRCYSGCQYRIPPWSTLTWTWDLLDKVAEALEDNNKVTPVHAKRRTTHHGEAEPVYDAKLAAAPRDEAGDGGSEYHGSYG